MRCLPELAEGPQSAGYPLKEQKLIDLSYLIWYWLNQKIVPTLRKSILILVKMTAHKKRFLVKLTIYK